MLVDVSLNVSAGNRDDRNGQNDVAAIGCFENHEAGLIIFPGFTVVNQRELNGETFDPIE